MSEQKQYVGGAKEINGNFGAFHRISFSQQDLELLLQNLNEKGYVNLNMNKRREPSQYGQTHSLVIDTWQPQPQQQMPQPPQANNFQNPQAVNSFQQGNNQNFQPPVNQPPVYQEPAQFNPQQAFENVQPMMANPQYQQPPQG
jgi:hypothetical protein